MKGQAGFSLVELMVVITIIGILAGIAVPRFQTFRARAMQAEARAGLHNLSLALHSANAVNEFPTFTQGYAPDVTRVSFAMTGVNQRYQYSVDSQPRGFAAMAASPAAIIGDDRDFWRTNTNNMLCAPWDAVSQAAVPFNCPQFETSQPAAIADLEASYEAESDCAAGLAGCNPVMPTPE